MGHKTVLRNMAGNEPVTAEMVLRASAEGDPVAGQIVTQMVRCLAIGLGGLVNTLDICLIVLGGGLMKAGPEFLRRIEVLTRHHVFSPEARRDLRFVPESLPNSALFGAAANVFSSTVCGDRDVQRKVLTS
jgi:glucokinase